jgi:Activator of Hsp90 ATPase homolog 1-like protein
MNLRAPEPVRVTVLVPQEPVEAFALFADRFGSWWPREYTWSQATLRWIGLEPRVGGRCYEIGPNDFHSDWGRVLVWERPVRLVLAWQISPRREPEPDPARASEVEVRFESEEGGTTRVTLEHRGFERHGPGAAGYRVALASAQGWPWILGRYAAAAG